MKKNLLRITKFSLCLGCILLLLYACGFGRYLIGTGQVEKIELTACDQEGTSTVELNENDVRQFITYFNLSRFVGQVTAERCERTFSVCIHMKDGRKIHIVDHDDKRMKVTGLEDQSIWLGNPMLFQAVKNLVHDYDLIWNNWGCCTAFEPFVGIHINRGLGVPGFLIFRFAQNCVMMSQIHTEGVSYEHPTVPIK